ncbi:MAG: 2-C-methyl-D-erythritol 4-phosphate cytidylyltransferase [Pseudobutyrivibrio sp.]|nr:2-C-methyl-D-erythritol 4-phosphate cytidylyltransferase [Pseudobutyrivibrio sp.]
MNVALLLAGGCGTRMKCDIPKQLIKIKDKPLMCYALAALFDCELVDAVQIVLPEVYRDYMIAHIMEMSNCGKLLGFSNPGETRQHSILNGLMDIEMTIDDEDIVLIQDGARPLATQAIIRDCIERMDDYDGVMPVIPVKDAIYASRSGKSIDSLMKRDELYAGQAPEAFIFGKYFRINMELANENRIDDIKGSTEAAILGGLNIKLIPGKEDNFKITTKEDLTRFISIVGF